MLALRSAPRKLSCAAARSHRASGSPRRSAVHLRTNATRAGLLIRFSSASRWHSVIAITGSAVAKPKANVTMLRMKFNEISQQRKSACDSPPVATRERGNEYQTRLRHRSWLTGRHAEHDGHLSAPFDKMRCTPVTLASRWPPSSTCCASGVAQHPYPDVSHLGSSRRKAWLPRRQWIATCPAQYRNCN